MSIARVHVVKAARKDQGKCGHCGIELNKGDGYKWWKHRYGSKGKRCLKPSCAPSRATLESSVLAEMYGAEDAALNAISSAEGKQDLEQAVEEFADALDSWAEERRAAADAWENGNEQMEERASTAESAAEQVREWTPDDFDGDEGDETDEREEWMEEQRQAAEGAISEAMGEIY